jgi:hypothetical protein
LPRSAAAALALALAACVGQASDEHQDGAGAGDLGDDGGDDSGGAGEAPPDAECAVAADCVAAASTCCECPSFAVPSSSGYDQACDEVDCEPPSGCSAAQPACVGGACQLVCTPIATDLSCELGFARDDFGCLVDACATAPDAGADECELDADCVQVPADCCGCAAGGEDTAVPADQVDEHEDGLDCRADPTCPDVDLCDPSREPRCVYGHCELSAPPGDGSGDDVPSVRCGIDGDPPCEGGQVCVLNHPDGGDATRAGAGSCQNL